MQSIAQILEELRFVTEGRDKTIIVSPETSDAVRKLVASILAMSLSMDDEKLPTKLKRNYAKGRKFLEKIHSAAIFNKPITMLDVRRLSRGVVRAFDVYDKTSRRMRLRLDTDDSLVGMTLGTFIAMGSAIPATMIGGAPMALMSMATFIAAGAFHTSAMSLRRGNLDKVQLQARWGAINSAHVRLLKAIDLEKKTAAVRTTDKQ